MAVGTVSGVDPSENWQLIATNTPSAATISSFTSISGYKRLMVVMKITNAASMYVYLQFNSDTTSGNYGAASGLDGTYSTQSLTGIPTGYTTSSNPSGYVIIEDTDKSMPHRVSGAGANAISINGMWFTANPITQIDVKTSASTITGTIYLYGIAA